jgi:hypothetical protein
VHEKSGGVVPASGLEGMGALPESTGAVPFPVAGGVRMAGGALPDPEQVAVTEGVQTKASPQSLSTLQGNCHLKAQVEIVVVVQTGGGDGAGGSHFVLGGQPAVPVLPPEHEATLSAWQTIPAPQSPSA